MKETIKSVLKNEGMFVLGLILLAVSFFILIGAEGLLRFSSVIPAIIGLYLVIKSFVNDFDKLHEVLRS